MSSRNTFLLSIETTLAIGWFGIIGAIYVELSRPVTQMNDVAITFDLMGIIIVGFIIFGCFWNVNRNINLEKSGK